MGRESLSQGLIASDGGDHGITSPGPREGCIQAMFQRNVLSRCDSSWLMTGEEIAGPVLERELVCAGIIPRVRFRIRTGLSRGERRLSSSGEALGVICHRGKPSNQGRHAAVQCSHT